MSNRALSSSRPLLAAVLVLSAGAGDVLAQAEQAPPPPPPPEPVQAPLPPAEPAADNAREGFLLGGSVGFGGLDLGSDSQSTMNYHIELGGFLRSNWAIAVGFWGGQHDQDGLRLTNSNAGLMTQYWFQEAFWIKGAIGQATLHSEIDSFSYPDYNGMAIGGMFGWDFYDRGSYHMHASLGLTLEGYENLNDNVTATAFQLGVQYY